MATRLRQIARRYRRFKSSRTAWDDLPSTLCVQCDAVVGGVVVRVGVCPHEVHSGPRCQTASDGAAVKGAASAVREAQAEGPTLTGATPMRPSWRVRKGSLSMSGSRARSARCGGPQRSRRRARLAPESAEPRLCLRQRHRPPLERSTVRSSLSGRKSGGVACSSKWRPWGPTWTSYPSRNYFGSVETSCVSSGRAGSSAAATPRRATTPSFSLNGSPTANLRRTLKRAGT
jgi:hypothetical protein